MFDPLLTWLVLLLFAVVVVVIAVLAWLNACEPSIRGKNYRGFANDRR